MLDFERLAEQRIAEAIARGELEDLPGSGKPLALDDDALIAPELRLAYRVLKNAGYVPQEVALRKEIADVTALFNSVEDERERVRAARRLSLLRAKLDARGGLRVQDQYYEKVLDRFGAGSS